jgi:hypothetical protein
MIELGYCVSAGDHTEPPGPCRCQNRTSVPHAAWSAMFIDPRSCHPTASLSEACGPGYESNGKHHSRKDPGFWDITETEVCFPKCSEGVSTSIFIGQQY